MMLQEIIQILHVIVKMVTMIKEKPSADNVNINVKHVLKIVTNV